MEKDDKGSTVIRMGVSGWMLLLVPAYPGCPGSKAVKRSLLLLFWYRLTWVVPEKGPLNGCVCVCVVIWNNYDNLNINVWNFVLQSFAYFFCILSSSCVGLLCHFLPTWRYATMVLAMALRLSVTNRCSVEMDGHLIDFWHEGFFWLVLHCVLRKFRCLQK